MEASVIDKKELFLQQFRDIREPSGAGKLAELALDALDFPTTRHEYWKYTRLAKIQNAKFHTAPFNPGTRPWSVNEEALHIDCVNGQFGSVVGEIQKGIEISVIDEIEETIADVNHEFFAALNSAYFTSGIKIKVDAGVQVEKSIQINFQFDQDSVAGQPRVEVEVERGAKLNLIFTWQNEVAASCFANVVSEMKVADNAALHVHQLQQGGDENYLINSTNVVQGRDSRFAIHTISLEGKILRNNLNIAVEGENCETRLNGVYLTHGKQHFDNHTYVDHKVPNCFSSENYKGVLNDRSTAVFNGKVMVRQDAQKINAFQNNQNILMSDDATINSKPELEIYADDVKCSHGSTTGQLDEEATFYLRSRGVSEASAKKMLIKAFVFDVLEEIELDSFRNYTEELVEAKYKL